MIRLPLLAALTLLTAAPSMPQSPTQTAAQAPVRSYPAIQRIDWTYGTDTSHGASATQLRFSHKGSMSSFGADEVPEIVGELAAASLASPGEAVSFALAREAGALACTGRATEPGRAAGTCRFDPDERYVAELARRGLVPEDSGEVLVLALVDGRTPLVDDLTRLGYAFEDVGDLIAVGALDVTPAFAEGLREAGLVIDELGDLIAAQALGLDAEWLMAMARAGYPELEIEQAIQMRALGVTPDYARRMSRVLSATGRIQ
jgi:hypothetical protein